MLPLIAIVLSMQQSGTGGGVSPPAATQDAPSPTAPESPPVAAPAEDAVRALKRFDAALAGLRVYEASIPALAWEQEVVHEPLPRAGGKQTTPFRSSVVVAPDGRWSLHLRMSRPDGEKTVRTEERFLFDGERLLSSAPGSRVGTVNASTTSPWLDGLPSPLMFVRLRRGDGPVERRNPRISDMFADLQEVEVDESAAPLIRVSGSQPSREGLKGWTRIEITLDRERGFMPTRFRRTDEIFDVLREEIAMTAVEQVGGVWIPTGGTRVVFALQPSEAFRAKPPEEAAQIGKEFTERVAAAKLDIGKRADRMRMREILRAVCKGEMMQGEPIGDGRAILRAWSLRALTSEEADRALVPPFGEGDSVTDLRTGTELRFRNGKLVPAEGAGREKPAPHATGN